MIDLHLHTTASDGTCTPEELVWRAHAAGVTVMSVTDHDTTAGVKGASQAASACGLECVPGIEITAVWNGRDVHVLGYFVDPASPTLQAFLDAQRQDRIRRLRRMGARLAALGAPVDVEAVLLDVAGRPHRAVGRPRLAAALVAAGHVASPQEAFERYLGDGCPAFVPREGASPEEVIALIGRAGGIASLAHPGLLGHDELIPGLVRAGLAAIEAYYARHPPETVRWYCHLAARHGLAVSGGSDFHGDGSRDGALGTCGLPPEAFADLCSRRVSGPGSRAPR